MNKYLDIIPTPKSMEYTDGSALCIKTVRVHAEMTPQMNHALNLLKGDSGCVLCEDENADAVLYDKLERIKRSDLYSGKVEQRMHLRYHDAAAASGQKYRYAYYT